MTFWESFWLLLIGAVISFVLGTWLTKRWQNNMKKLDIKVDIGSKIAEFVSYQTAKTTISTKRRKETFTDADKDEYFEDMREGYVDFSIIRSKLESYFPNLGIRERWTIISYFLAHLVMIHDNTLKRLLLMSGNRVT
jgi:hypothetical protein